eukprot:TRINITY_DN19404_c0_g1_i1.p1 TRINITY_DN19404_c0_g1~~TRINITY_DN19404_c0_g1_i1.p1  ORF type:complete len:665 (-),score=100.82 TRINITY_DN19404_c0_g1_i1:236-2230(-)
MPPKTPKNRQVQIRASQQPQQAAKTPEAKLQAHQQSSSQGKPRTSQHQQSRSARLSFVDLETQRIVRQISALGPQIGLNESTTEGLINYVLTVLTGTVSEQFHLDRRSLSYWVQVFNRWQQLKGSKGSGKGEKAPSHLDYHELQHVLGVTTKNIVNDAIKLFDSEGAKNLSSTGHQQQVLKSIKVPIQPLMLAGVALSPFISDRNKAAFFIGLFDEQGSGGLGENDFCRLQLNLMRAMCKVFSAEMVMDRGQMETYAMAFYDRMSKYAAECVLSKIANHTFNKEDVRKAILLRKTQVHEDVGGSGNVKAQPATRIPVHVLTDCLCQEAASKDPLLFLNKLFIMRWSASRLNPDFEDEYGPEFALSYSSPVPVAKESNRLTAADLPTRPEVVLVRDVLDRWGNDLSEIHDVHGTFDDLPTAPFVRSEFKINLITLLRNDLGCLKGDHAFFVLLSKMYPKTKPRHLQIFHVWCDEYDAIIEEQTRADTARKANESFREDTSKPVIPEIELYKLKKMFSDIDFDGSGAVDVHEMETHFNYMKKKREISEAEYDELMGQFSRAGLDENGCLSLNQFCMVMCPPNFRLPTTLGVGRRVIAAFLEFASTSHDSQMKKSKSNFGYLTRTENEQHGRCTSTSCSRGALEGMAGCFQQYRCEFRWPRDGPRVG